MITRRFLHIVSITVTLTIFMPLILLAQWSGDSAVNTEISRLGWQESHPVIVSDGANGGIIVWKTHSGDSGLGYDIHAQRIDVTGKIKWSPEANICVQPGNQEHYDVVSDGDGGAIIVWTDGRVGIEADIYAQKIDGSGKVLWTKDGIPICNKKGVQADPQLVSDGSGGAIITWRDGRDYNLKRTDIYAQRVDASGNSVWATNGVVVCNAGSEQLNPVLVSDDSGGAIIAWNDQRGVGATGWDIYFQRLSSSGTPQWVSNGVGYLANGNQTWKGRYSPIASDGSGGAFIAWEDDYFGQADIDIRMIWVNASGVFPWPGNSMMVAAGSNNQKFPHLASDNSGGTYITWQDYFNNNTAPDIRAQYVNTSGGAQWKGGGKIVCDAADKQEFPQVITNAIGRAIIVWHDYRNYKSSKVDIYAQSLDSAGNVLWNPNGVIVSNALNNQYNPMLTFTNKCAAIITWYDYRWEGDPWNDTDWDIYAQRVNCDGSLPGK